MTVLLQVLLLLHICSIYSLSNVKIYKGESSKPFSNVFNGRKDTSLKVLHELPSMLLDNADIPFAEVLQKASIKAFNGGIAGASAAAVQVGTLMWLRTAINYQYRFGGTLQTALSTLYKEGGIGRMYQGLPFALAQGPLARFGDTASNALILVLLESLDPNQALFPLFVRTGLGSVVAGLWRIVIMPVDNAKTILQVNGLSGLDILKTRVQSEGLGVLYNGAGAASLATLAGHYPWFLTFNYLSSHLPPAHSTAELLSLYHMAIDDKVLELMRSAFIGLCASSLSDTCTNSIRVLKTYRQTSSQVSYQEIVQDIVQKEGWQGLFGRGLQSKLLGNALQGMLFSVVFRYLQAER